MAISLSYNAIRRSNISVRLDQFARLLVPEGQKKRNIKLTTLTYIPSPLKPILRQLKRVPRLKRLQAKNETINSFRSKLIRYSIKICVFLFFQPSTLFHVIKTRTIPSHDFWMLRTCTALLMSWQDFMSNQSSPLSQERTCRKECRQKTCWFQQCETFRFYILLVPTTREFPSSSFR
ncbi:unnamed protein product [Albugo candida]|uniref:Uncharacterized protein n=1 Tax=Albugo candida TaxID=65357 RepID=A0A024FU91_9STRA|nr:unnamed protein product [Albugo candida]|eukprot:CCI10723.1 unnamed protein product [Albugo candida]